MSQAFDAAVADLIAIEGDYSDDQKDSGGKTRWGVTEAVAREAGYAGAMRDLDQAQARAIYKRAYWDAMRLDDVATLSVPVAEELFDTGVNCGTGVAGRFLQRALNALNRQQMDYGDEIVDGAIGLLTLQQLRRFLTVRVKDGEIVLLRALNALQGARYITLAESREKDERFVFGWFLNRVAPF